MDYKEYEFKSNNKKFDFEVCDFCFDGKHDPACKSVGWDVLYLLPLDTFLYIVLFLDKPQDIESLILTCKWIKRIFIDKKNQYAV